MDEKMHVVSEEDLVQNPELVEADIKVGDEIGLPPESAVCSNCDDSGKACVVCHAGSLVE